MSVQRKRLGHEAKSYCNNVTRTTKNNFFQRVIKSGFANNKKFWNKVKPFLTNKGFLTNNDISINVNDGLVTDKTKLIQTSQY